MPASIDRIGRAHEWGVAWELIKDPKFKEKRDLYFRDLNSIEKRRVVVGSRKTAEKILEYNKTKKISGAKVIGEENKKSGPEDSDIEIIFSDKTKKNYSLKLQSSSRGVNVRNFTLNSIVKNFTNKPFDEFLSDKEKEFYSSKGLQYSQGKIDSNVLGVWGSRKLSEILNDIFHQDTKPFLKKLFEEIRFKTNLIITIVDKKGVFLGYSTKFNNIFNQVLKKPSLLNINFKGISVFMKYNRNSLLKLDIFMMSDSTGLGKKLRGVIRIDFPIDKSTKQKTL